MVGTPSESDVDPFGSDLPSIPRVRRQGARAPPPGLPPPPRRSSQRTPASSAPSLSDVNEEPVRIPRRPGSIKREVTSSARKMTGRPIKKKRGRRRAVSTPSDDGNDDADSLKGPGYSDDLSTRRSIARGTVQDDVASIDEFKPRRRIRRTSTNVEKSKGKQSPKYPDADLVGSRFGSDRDTLQESSFSGENAGEDEAPEDDERISDDDEGDDENDADDDIDEGSGVIDADDDALSRANLRDDDEEADDNGEDNGIGDEDDDDMDDIDLPDSVDNDVAGQVLPAKTKGHVASKATLDELGEYSEDDFDSDGFKSKPSGLLAESRLTMRQRALQGEDLGGALAKLASPQKRKRKASDDDLTKDEAMDITKQQKARLRNLVHEKRNKEKRAAMVDKVLRGVTSKRKKQSQANEALAAEVGSRLNNNEARPGFLRYRSGPEGSFISVAPGEELPSVLACRSQLASYPMKCERDPRTGKRIFPSAVIS